MLQCGIIREVAVGPRNADAKNGKPLNGCANGLQCSLWTDFAQGVLLLFVAHQQGADERQGIDR